MQAAECETADAIHAFVFRTTSRQILISLAFRLRKATHYVVSGAPRAHNFMTDVR